MTADFEAIRQKAENSLATGQYADAERLFSQAATLAETFEASDSRQTCMLSRLGTALSNQHKYAEAQKILERVVAIKTEQFGPDHLEVAHSLNDLAGLLYEQSQYRQAMPLCTKILNIYERSLGSDHVDVATVSVNLAMLHHTQNEFAQAEQMYKRALDIRTAKLNSEHPDVINVLENYAALLLATGRNDEAEYLKTCVLGRVSGRMRSTMHDMPAFKPSA